MTVERGEKTVEELTKISGIRKSSPAVAFAVRNCVNRKKAKEFGKMLREGGFDCPATNEEIEKQDI
jgi:hypothetical protein